MRFFDRLFDSDKCRIAALSTSCATVYGFIHGFVGRYFLNALQEQILNMDPNDMTSAMQTGRNMAFLCAATMLVMNAADIMPKINVSNDSSEARNRLTM